MLTIGQAGENLCRVACLIHDAGNASGQGGFGAVWGSKKLKAISVIGSGSIEIADPRALLQDRLWTKEHYNFDVCDAENMKKVPASAAMTRFGGPATPMVFWKRPEEARPQACFGCHSGCRARHASGMGNESSCGETMFYTFFDQRYHSNFIVRTLADYLESNGHAFAAQGLDMILGKQTPAAYTATDLVQQYGINAFELMVGLPYLRDLYKMGELGPGKRIDSDLRFDQIGSSDFAEELISSIAHRRGIGNDVAEGFYRAAGRWERQEQDLRSGLLLFPQWGLPSHYDPRGEVEWGYGSVLGDRDINEHGFNQLFWMPTMAAWMGQESPYPAEQLARIFADKLEPFAGDLSLLDFSEANAYSESTVKLVAWHRRYTRFWKQSVLFCNLLLPDFVNHNRPDGVGLTGEGEPRFFRSVTGRALSFADGIELGRRIWNLDNAIWTLQGRHRDMVKFADYIHDVPYGGFGSSKSYMPGKEDGVWKFVELNGRTIDRQKFEEWKSMYYRFEGWDPASGWPTRRTLEDLELGYVADVLEEKQRLGKEVEA